jgi:hypothetical protein
MSKVHRIQLKVNSTANKILWIIYILYIYIYRERERERERETETLNI